MTTPGAGCVTDRRGSVAFGLVATSVPHGLLRGGGVDRPSVMQHLPAVCLVFVGFGSACVGSACASADGGERGGASQPPCETVSARTANGRRAVRLCVRQVDECGGSPERCPQITSDGPVVCAERVERCLGDIRQMSCVAAASDMPSSCRW